MVLRSVASRSYVSAYFRGLPAPALLHGVNFPMPRFPSTTLSDITHWSCVVNLSHLTVTIQKSDPDVIVGHEFLGVSLDVLLGRMKDLKADHWSRIGRFRRTKMNLGRPGTNLRLLYGRLVCDLASDGAKVRHQNSFSPVNCRFRWKFRASEIWLRLRLLSWGACGPHALNAIHLCRYHCLAHHIPALTDGLDENRRTNRMNFRAFYLHLTNTFLLGNDFFDNVVAHRDVPDSFKRRTAGNRPRRNCRIL